MGEDGRGPSLSVDPVQTGYPKARFSRPRQEIWRENSGQLSTLSAAAFTLSCLVRPVELSVAGSLSVTPTCPAANENREPDEGLSHVVVQGSRAFTLKEAVELEGAKLVGATIWEQYRRWPVYSKFFDNMGPIPHHMHQNTAQAALVGQQGKPESYYFPPQLNAIGNNFPHTFFGLEPGTTRDDVRRCLAGYLQVKSLWEEEKVVAEVRAWIRGKQIDRIECLWEPGMTLAGRMREALGVPGLRLAQAQAFRDKERMKQVLVRAGVRTPSHARARTKDECREAAERFGYPLIIKPIAGAGSADTYPLRGPEDLEPWDLAYYGEKLKEQRLDLNDEVLRPYFPLPAVLDGLFKLVQRLYGVRVVPESGVSVWTQRGTVCRSAKPT